MGFDRTGSGWNSVSTIKLSKQMEARALTLTYRDIPSIFLSRLVVVALPDEGSVFVTAMLKQQLQGPRPPIQRHARELCR